MAEQSTWERRRYSITWTASGTRSLKVQHHAVANLLAHNSERPRAKSVLDRSQIAWSQSSGLTAITNWISAELNADWNLRAAIHQK